MSIRRRREIREVKHNIGCIKQRLRLECGRGTYSASRERELLLCLMEENNRLNELLKEGSIDDRRKKTEV